MGQARMTCPLNLTGKVLAPAASCARHGHVPQGSSLRHARLEQLRLVDGQPAMPLTSSKSCEQTATPWIP